MDKRRIDGREELRIGGIFPLTGYLSWSGKYKRKAAELKVEMINRAGGIDGRPARLIAYDDQSSSHEASRIAETLVFKHRVVAMVGTGSLPISRAVAQVANRYRVPAFINSGYAIDPAKDLFVFNTAHKTEYALACSFQYFMEKGIDRLALLMPQGPLGELGSWLARRLGSRMGIRIVGEERFDLGATDVSSSLRRLRDLKPGALFSFATGQPAARVAESMAMLRLRLPLLVSHGNANPHFLKLISHTPVDLVVPSGKTMALDEISEDDPCRKTLVDFNARHIERYGEPANYYSAELADAIDLLAEGVRRAGGTEPEQLRDAIEDIRAFEGMQGVYDLSPIDHYGTRIEQIILLTVKDGTWQFARAFSSLALFEDVHGASKTRLIRNLVDLLGLPESDSPVPPSYMADLPGSFAARTGLTCTDLGPDLYFLAKLYCQQKREMMRNLRERGVAKAKENLFRLLTVVLLQHFENLEAFKLSVLELFLALFDVAVEQGVDVEELLRLRHRFTVEWEQVKDQERACLWIARVLSAIGEKVCSSRGKEDRDLLEQVKRFIEAHVAEELSARLIAREVCLSPSRLMHRLRNEHNASLGRCVVRARIEKAKNLLRNTAMPIGTVAQEVGYKDQGYFTRVFSKEVGETPRQYRHKFCPFPDRRLRD